MKSPRLSADAVQHVTNSVESVLSDIVTSLRHCERQVIAATEDKAMQDTTEDTLIEVARLLSVIGRVIDWECSELGRLSRLADEEAQRPVGISS